MMKTITHLAIKHKPPCLKFQYTKQFSTTFYHKCIGIDLSDYSETLNLITSISEKHPELCQVPTHTLVDLIDRLSFSRHAESNVETNDVFISPTVTVSTKYEDLNRASEEHLTLAKKEMNVLFKHTLIAPGDATYEYDKRIEFEADEESSWD